MTVTRCAVARGGYAMLLNATNYQGLGTNRNTTKRERMDEAEGRRGDAETGARDRHAGSRCVVSRSAVYQTHHREIAWYYVLLT